MQTSTGRLDNCGSPMIPEKDKPTNWPKLDNGKADEYTKMIRQKNTFRYLSDIFQIILAILKMYLMYHHFQNWVPSFETWPIKKMTWDPCSLFLTEWSWSATFGQTLSAFGGVLPFSDKPIQKRIEPDPKVCTPWIIWVSFSALTSPQFWKLAFFVLKQMRGF